MIKPILIAAVANFLVHFLSQNVFAQTNVAVVLATKGDVQIFRAPDSSPNGPFVIYEGVKYAAEPAKIGKKVRPQEIIHSANDGRAKIVYPNGDHFIVGPGTSMVVPTETAGTDKDASSSIKLFYGKVRSLVSKNGPRNRMKVSTPTAVAGVRGTDFFIQHNPVEGTQLTVVRGEVEVKKNAENAKAISVKKGYVATTEKAGEPTLTEATKEELKQIQDDSVIKPEEKEIAALPEEAKKEIKTLNEKSKEAVLNDVKIDDPTLYEQLKKQKEVDAQVINSAAVAKLLKTAPAGAKKKPSREEMERLGNDVYDKYYKDGKKK